ncbi:MAG: hypothetical protein B9S32_17765 [Verrucomicrobia bacterium Tous-C9LFEB]|nr:MAG: hypothetical protein B9S32_17765 [Verrucomicrobia bacterium Tous-C9LFEB]
MTEEKKAGQKTVAQRVEQFGRVVDQRLGPLFAAQGVPYPPERIVFVGIKKDKQLEVHAAGKGQELRLIRSYPILCASGKLGPKLREGDRQVPEGLYAIQLLNPNSLYHLSLRVNYPNDFDRVQGAKDGRTQLGGDIMIHGKNVSIGCLAMGDDAAEDLFILAARSGIKNIRVILTPVDFRKETVTAAQLGQPAWVQGLYADIARELIGLK